MPSSDEYLKRFPQFKKQVRYAFFEPSQGSGDSAASTDGDDHTASLRDSKDRASALAPTYDLPDVNRLGDYELTGRLGHGGMGIVYEARHTKTHNCVALKTLPTGGDGEQVNADKLYRFRKEFRRLSEINHPNLVGMQSLEVDDDRWFFTMDLIEGQDFLNYVRPDDRLDEERLRSCLKQLATGIMELHRRGIIHRDLKPSNVLVSPAGHVTILDFGLAAQLQRSSDLTQTKTGMFAGTPAYAAPEQLFGERTEASDWYAFGTMLFEALTGARPFQDPNPMKLLRMKQEQVPPQLAVQDGLPEDLSTLTDGLLRREPVMRLSSEAIGDALGIAEETRAPGSTRDSQGSSGSTAGEEAEAEEFKEEQIVLIGREKQLAQLEELKGEFLETCQPKVTWVTGLSGEGKTSLLEKFLRPLRGSSELLVLSGRCYDRESVPFKAIDCWMDSLVAHLRQCDMNSDRDFLPDDIYLLAHVFPILRRVPSISQAYDEAARLPQSRQLKYRAFAALMELLQKLSKRTPVILMIDDLQWGDTDSADALLGLLRLHDTAAIWMLGSYRRDEAEESPFLDRWRGNAADQIAEKREHLIEVSGLTAEQTRALVEMRQGSTISMPSAQVNALFEGTQGNPFLIEKLADSYDPKDESVCVRGLEETIRIGLERLPPQAASLLQVVAIAGKPIELNEAATVSGCADAAFDLAHRMRNEQLIRWLGTGDRSLVETYHDKIRETIAISMSEESRRELHQRCGDQIERLTGVTGDIVSEFLATDLADELRPEFDTSRINDLAYHFYAARDRRAFVYQLMAGELAHQSYAPEESIEHLNRAVECVSGGEPSSQLYRLWHHLGASCSRSLQFDAGLQHYQRAAKVAPSSLAEAMAYVGQASIFQTLARFGDATKHHDLALNAIGRPRPSGLRAQWALGLLVLKHFLLSKRSRKHRADYSQSKETNLESAIYLDAAQYKFDQDVPLIDYPLCLAMMFDSSSRSNELNTQIAGLANFGVHVAVSGLPKAGRRLADRAARQSAEMTDAELQGCALYTMAVACSGREAYDETESKFLEAIALLRRAGGHMHTEAAMHMLRHHSELMGSSGSELRYAEELLEQTTRTGSRRWHFCSLYDCAGASARAGKLADAHGYLLKAEALRSSTEINMAEGIYFAQRTFVLLQTSDYQRARDNADLGCRTCWNRRLLMEWAVRSLPLWLEALAGPDWYAPVAKPQSSVLRSRLRAGFLLSRLYPRMRPLIDRCRGRVLWGFGSKKNALKCLRSAVKLARAAGYRWDLARSLLALAMVEDHGRDVRRREAVVLLREIESVIPRAESWLLGDQYDEAVVAPEFDLEAWEREHGPISPTIGVG